MLKENYTLNRNLKSITLSTDLIVVGGGLSGVCAALTAARAGVQVILIQDRPILGGNSSSEVRLWILGATSHMGNNNRWSREGGVIDEILVENTFKNPEGNPLIFDTILLDKVAEEKNITLLLNTAVHEISKSSEDIISGVKAFCSQNSTSYNLTANLFCDCSGDGVLGFLSGASFRMGAESREEFDEKFAPSKAYGELLGHSLYFYSKDTGKPVKYIAPQFALSDITTIPRFKSFNAQDFGCKLWWIEYGGRLDTVHDTEKIKWELWKVVYGTWNYIKNSGNFPEAENLALEWVGMIPGKRESRRFEGDFMLSQKDIIEQKLHFDAVAYGGWSIDLHPADGIFSEKPGCNQWHPKGIFQIPYRCLYSKDIKNLFLAGRIISATHVAFASTRVMATSAYVAQAVGMAAKLCKVHHVFPRDIIKNNLISELQNQLQRSGQYIPHLRLKDDTDLVQTAKIRSSSELQLTGMNNHVLYKNLDISAAQMIPLEPGEFPEINLLVEGIEETTLSVELRISSKTGNFTPDITIDTQLVSVKKGKHQISLNFNTKVTEQGYTFLIFKKNPLVRLGFTDLRITGILSVFNGINKAVSNYGIQSPTEDIGVEAFEFWCPQRRPNGLNIALSFQPGLNVFQSSNVKNGINRPTTLPNAWVAQLEDQAPQLLLEWDVAQDIKRIELNFDTDYDHPMESVLMSHPESIMPFCVRDYQIKDENGKLLFEKKDNYQSINNVEFEKAIHTRKIILTMSHPSSHVPAALFGIRCYN